MRAVISVHPSRILAICELSQRYTVTGQCCDIHCSGVAVCDSGNVVILKAPLKDVPNSFFRVCLINSCRNPSDETTHSKSMDISVRITVMDRITINGNCNFDLIGFWLNRNLDSRTGRAIFDCQSLLASLCTIKTGNSHICEFRIGRRTIAPSDGKDCTRKIQSISDFVFCLILSGNGNRCSSGLCWFSLRGICIA